MLKETRELYERLGKRAKLPITALKILHEAGLKTPYKGVDYTIGNIYAVLRDQYQDQQVEAALIAAAKKYLEKQKLDTSDIQESLLEMQ